MLQKDVPRWFISRLTFTTASGPSSPVDSQIELTSEARVMPNPPFHL